jgi:hypothetical protein
MKSAGRKSSIAAAAVQEPDAADARCSAKRWSSAGSWRSTAEALEEPELVGQEESAAKKHKSSSSITRKSSSATRASETSFSTTTPRSSPRTRTTAAPAPTEHKVASSKKKTATPKNKAIKHTFKKGKPNWDKIHARQFAKMKTIAPKHTKTLGKHFSKVKCRGTFTIQYKVTITRSSLFFLKKISFFEIFLTRTPAVPASTAVKEILNSYYIVTLQHKSTWTMTFENFPPDSTAPGAVSCALASLNRFVCVRCV